MRLKHFTWLIALALIAYTVADLQAAARPGSKKGTYFLQCLNGGSAGCLDALDITGAGNPNDYDLIEGDSAFVTTISGDTVAFYIYVFDASGTDAESSPDVIRPDDYTSAGVWRAVKLPFAIDTAAELETAAGLGAFFNSYADTATAAAFRTAVGLSSAVTALGSVSTTQTLDPGVYSLTVAGAFTLSVDNFTNNEENFVRLYITGDGSNSITWGSGEFDFVAGSAPTQPFDTDLHIVTLLSIDGGTTVILLENGGSIQ